MSLLDPAASSSAKRARRPAGVDTFSEKATRRAKGQPEEEEDDDDEEEPTERPLYAWATWKVLLAEARAAAAAAVARSARREEERRGAIFCCCC